MPALYKIKKGDTLTKLSEKFGLWANTIWTHPDNQELRLKRPDMNVLLAGDILTIPDKTPKDLPAATDEKHIYKRRGIPARYRVKLQIAGEPLTNVPYWLTVDGATRDGVTDSDGIADEFIPPKAELGYLYVSKDDKELRLTINFGRLDPLTTIAGLQQRLTNLGFPCIEDRAKPGLATVRALRRFQRKYGLSDTGKPDPQTLSKLAEIHDTTVHQEPATAGVKS